MQDWVWIESEPPQPTTLRPDPPQSGPILPGLPPTQHALSQSSLQYHVSHHLADVLAHLLHTPAHTFWSGELVHGGVSLECGGFAASDGEVPVIPQPLNPTPTDTHTCVDVYIMQGHL